tara:strand:- start:9542 stop:9787 length:246 start_codon:yes stop_codon:yes gene_type:complete
MHKDGKVKGVLVPMEKLLADGIRLDFYKYRANAFFKGGYVLKRVRVFGEFCLAVNDDETQGLIFRENDQEKPFLLEKLLEN